MKRLVTLISVVFTFSGLQAQIKMSSNGNVGIQSSVVPEAALVVGGNASHKGTGYMVNDCSHDYQKPHTHLFHNSTDAFI